MKEDEDVSYRHLTFVTTMGPDKETVGGEAAKSSSRV
jgi:hypothetical protein